MVNWAQVLLNSAVTGSLFALVAVGLTLTYSLSRFPNFVHAEFITLGAYVGYAIAEQLDLGLPLGFLAAFAASGALGAASYLCVFRPLQQRGATLIHLMVASISLGFVVRHCIQEAWGRAPLLIRIVWARYDVGPVRVTGLWLFIIAMAAAMALTTHVVLTRTKIGKAMRATSNNPELAMASGINVDRVMLLAWIAGAMLAGIGGLLRACDARLVPHLGWEILLPAFTTTILGGIGNFHGMLAAAYVLGLAENIGVVALSALDLSTDYRPAVAFIILVIMLIFRPTGLFGRR